MNYSSRIYFLITELCSDQPIYNEHFSNALYLNVKQIWRYLSSYEGSNFPSNELEQLETLLQDIERLHQELARETVPQKNSFRREMILKSQSFLSSSREMCRSIWAQFDMNLIWIGTVIFAVALIINYVSMNGAFVDCNIIKLAAGCSFIAIVFQVRYGVHYYCLSRLFKML